MKSAGIQEPQGFLFFRFLRFCKHPDAPIQINNVRHRGKRTAVHFLFRLVTKTVIGGFIGILFVIVRELEMTSVIGSINS